MSYKVKIQTFEGPFDLLVYLIENAQMSIYDIEISSITELVARVIAASTIPGILGYLGVVIASPIAWVAAGSILPLCYFYYIGKTEKRFATHQNQKIEKTVDMHI